ncbi:hypothetical protein [Polyangium sorediatum]|uniref:Uncharacterized protein n=1 Tax=Polyangium sorediatum TaxID=889274 RepID=A0ABT6P6E7_9BACT|nr:hypothetical protein [Polyangium sorediatum]MDI1436196.1 hypothetical protein [Polyangium sorediatum]
MSDQGERPSYDPAEVRRCITLCFSAKDLRELAEGLGATGLPGEGRGIQDVAREVVRHFERQGSLDRLVEALKQARPLMEWPAPIARAGVPAAALAFPPPPPLAPLAPAAEPAPAPAPEPAPAPAAEPAPAPEPAAAPAPATAPEAGSAPAPTVIEPPRGPEAPLLRDPYAPGWPGTAPREPVQPVDGRRFTLLFAIAAVVIVIASVGAFLVGRAGSNAGPAPLLAGTDAMAKGERPLRESGPSRLAADAVRRSLGNLARGCDLPLAPSEEPGTDLFKSAYEQCGMRPMIGRPPSGPRPTRPADSAGGAPPAGGSDLFDTPTPAPAPTRAAPATQPRKTPATTDKPALPDNGAACVNRCSATQKQCNGGCGSEPTLSSEYGRWQACQAQCLSAASRCRLACQ